MAAMNESDTYTLIYDSRTSAINLGEFSGSIIMKLKGESPCVIFSDNLEMADNLVKSEGLKVGFEKRRPHSEFNIIYYDNLAEFDYIIQVSPDLIQKFEQARFSAIYPSIIRFLHTACLYKDTPGEYYSHISFVQGEILNQPVAISVQEGLILADRMVINDTHELIFYDAILVGRKNSGELTVSYEDFISVPHSNFKYVLIMGSEHF